MAAFLAVNLMMASAFVLLGDVRPSTPVLPALPAAPAKLLPSVELPEGGSGVSVGMVLVGDDASSVGGGNTGTP